MWLLYDLSGLCVAMWLLGVLSGCQGIAVWLLCVLKCCFGLLLCVLSGFHCCYVVAKVF